MKKKIIMIIAILVIIAIAVIAVFTLKGNFKKSYREPLDNDEKVLLAEKSYRNYAWGFVYRGSAIFNDGTIYEWDISDTTNSTNFEDSDIKDWILANGKKSDKKVTSQDLARIEKNIDNLENAISTENVAMDAGAIFTCVYKDGEQVTLIESGNFTGENETKESQALLKIIDKYLED